MMQGSFLSKTQAYMAMGKPILMAVRGDAADLVKEADAGVCCLPQNPRSTSLDELPELWNVIKGDMSIVGPRPLLVQYLGRYTPESRSGAMR